MTTKSGILALILNLCLAGVVIAQLPTPATPGTATLKGNVQASDSKQPLPNVRVELLPIPAGSRPPLRVATNRNGDFKLINIPEGNYVLAAQRAGYGAIRFSQKTGVATVSLKANQTFLAPLRMTPLGAVEGLVTGRGGQPVVHARVTLSYYRTIGEVKVLVPEREVWTSGQGTFRVSGVPDGAYFLSASSNDFVERANPRLIYATVFFPGVPDARNAQAIDVVEGKVLKDLNIQIGEAIGFWIAGRVSSNGAPVDGAKVVVRRETADGATTLLASDSGFATTDSDGNFTIPRLAAGLYHLMITGGSEAQKWTGSRRIDLRGGDALGIAVNAGSGASVGGRITIEGMSGNGKPPVRVFVRSSVDLGASGLIRASVADNLSFRLDNIPEGSGRFEASLMTDSYYVKAIRLNGQDVTGRPVEFHLTDRFEDVEVVISLAGAQINGRVGESEGSNASVILFPAENSLRLARPDLTRVARTDGAGHFTIRGIAPGTYELVALRTLPARATADAGILAAVRPLSQRVELAAGVVHNVVVLRPVVGPAR